MPSKKCPDCGKPLTTKPRYETRPTPRAKGWWKDIEQAAVDLGTPLIPWQKKAARLIGELRPDGRPRWKTIVITLPRQEGKTVISRATLHAKAQQDEHLELYGTADTGRKAVKLLIKMGEILEDLGVAKVKRGQGFESITWHDTGTVYEAIPPNDTAPHGLSPDFFLGDEAWTLTAVALGGIRPSMIAKPYSQFLLISTMGTEEESEVWNDFVEEGRASVEDPDSTIAYLEYSAAEDNDVWDESKWHDFMPALGYTISHEDLWTAIRDTEKGEGGRAEVIRAYGNRQTATMTPVFDPALVANIWTPVERPQRFALALDVNRDPDGASAAFAFVTDGEGDQEGKKVVAAKMEWEFGRANHWLIERLKQAIEAKAVETVVVDFGRQWPQDLRVEVEEICERANVPLVNRVPKDVSKDNQFFYDSIKDGTIVLHPEQELADSIEKAVRKDTPSGLWFIDAKKMSVDASPLISVILACGLAAQLDIRPVARGIAMAF